MATIKDVARESGLAVGTISRYLNGTMLKPKNQKRAEQAIARLGYERNTLAQSMKTGRSMTIAVVVPNLANMFSMRIIEQIERVLETKDYSVLIADCGGGEYKQLQKLSLLKNKMVDGFVLMPCSSNSAKIQAAVGSIPLVLIDRTLEEDVFDSVTVNNRQASYEAVKAVLRQGVRRIGMIEGPQNISTARERAQGYRAALEEFSISDQFVIEGGYTYESGYQAMCQLLPLKLEAVFTSNYELTVGAINAIQLSDERCLRLIGFDSMELANLIQLPYSFISQPIEEIGRQAAQLLLSRIENPQREVQHLILNTR